MRLLLDTHVLLWWQGDLSRISSNVRGLISDPDNQVFVSAASVWEISIKRRKGKLEFGGSPLSLIEALGFEELPVTGRDAESAGDLDWIHSDPFDRLILAQAMGRGFSLITADRWVRAYPGVAVIRAS